MHIKGVTLVTVFVPNKLGKGLPDNATSYMARLYAIWLQRGFSKTHFYPCELDMQRTATIVKEGHIRTIRAKFGQMPAANLGGYDF